MKEKKIKYGEICERCGLSEFGARRMAKNKFRVVSCSFCPPVLKEKYPRMEPHCERIVKSKERCGDPTVTFALGQSLCARHAPSGDSACTHSVGHDKCGYCGADIKDDPHA